MDKYQRLEDNERRARLGGGEARLKRQHAAGKLTAHERIDRFFEKTIGKPKPENILDYLRAELFLFKEVLSYLDTVRNKLKKG